MFMVEHGAFSLHIYIIKYSKNNLIAEKQSWNNSTIESPSYILWSEEAKQIQRMVQLTWWWPKPLACVSFLHVEPDVPSIHCQEC